MIEHSTLMYETPNTDFSSPNLDLNTLQNQNTTPATEILTRREERRVFPRHISDEQRSINLSGQGSNKMLYKFLDTTYIEYLVEKNVPHSREETLKQAEECVRFLYLSHLSPGHTPISKEIDDIWHLLILETLQYQSLCKKLPTKNFIHHKSIVYEKLSNPKKETSSNESEAVRNLEWLVSYVHNFGDFTQGSLSYWPFASALMKKLNLDLPTLNQKLHALVP